MVDIIIRKGSNRRGKYWRKGEVERIVKDAPPREVQAIIPKRVRKGFCHQDATKGDIDRETLAQGVEKMDPETLRQCLDEVGGAKGPSEPLPTESQVFDKIKKRGR